MKTVSAVLTSALSHPPPLWLPKNQLTFLLHSRRAGISQRAERR